LRRLRLRGSTRRYLRFAKPQAGKARMTGSSYRQGPAAMEHCSASPRNQQTAHNPFGEDVQVLRCIKGAPGAGGNVRIADSFEVILPRSEVQKDDRPTTDEIEGGDCLRGTVQQRCRAGEIKVVGTASAADPLHLRWRIQREHQVDTAGS